MLTALLLVNVTLVSTGLPPRLSSAPPLKLALLPLKVTLVRVRFPPLKIAPPLLPLFVLKVTLVRVGLLEVYIAPPRSLVLLALTIRLASVGVPLLLYIPPPRSLGLLPLALPLLMVKPSSTAVLFRPLLVTTW